MKQLEESEESPKSPSKFENIIDNLKTRESASLFNFLKNQALEMSNDETDPQKVKDDIHKRFINLKVKPQKHLKTNYHRIHSRSVRSAVRKTPLESPIKEVAKKNIMKKRESKSINNHTVNSNKLESKYFKMKKLDYMNCELEPEVRCLYHIAKLAEKQIINLVIPPTILLNKNHKNMFIYTKPSTK